MPKPLGRQVPQEAAPHLEQVRADAEPGADSELQVFRWPVSALASKPLSLSSRNKMTSLSFPCLSPAATGRGEEGVGTSFAFRPTLAGPLGLPGGCL